MRTQFISKMNKTEAGFHLLMTLGLADGSIQKAESSIILEYLEERFQEPIEIIKEQAFLRACPNEELINHFTEVAHQFYIMSSEAERNSLISFAMKVVMADKKMEIEENQYIHTLFDAWAID